MKCPECGENFPQDNKFCPGCGKKVSDFTYDAVNQSKNKKPIPTWQIIFILFCVVVGGFYVIYNYNNSSSVHSVQKPKRPDNYEIINEESYLNIKSSLDIRLKEKVDKNTLREIANELYSKRKKFERVFICYYLRGMEVNKGCWATSHYNPYLKIEILGITKDTEDKLRNDTEIIQGEMLGKWINNTPPSACVYSLINNNGNYTMTIIYSDGSKGTEDLLKKNVSSKIRYIKKNNRFGEYYIVNNDNTLGIYDKDGLISTIKKSK